MSERSLFVPGAPAAQGSKTYFGRGRMTEASKRLGPWRKTIAEAIIAEGWQHDPILTGPVWVDLTFYLPRPKHHYGTGRNANQLKGNAPVWVSTAVGDIDKLCRAVLDAITQARAWRDDAQVAGLHACRLYGHPGVLISIERQAVQR